MSNADALEVLIVEREIRNLIYTFCRAVDRGDRDLLRSLYHPDAKEEHGEYQGGVEGFIDHAMGTGDWAKEGLSHQITNMLMEVKGDVVTAETNFLAICARATSPKGEDIDLIIAGRYLDRFERRDGGAWKIAHRKVVYDSNHTFPASGLWSGPMYETFGPKGKPNRTDPLYHGPATPTEAGRK